MFCEWARDYYEFPIRVTIYFKASDTVRAMSGEQVSGKCSKPYNRLEEPHNYQWLNNTRQGDTEIEHRKNEREARKLGEKKVYQYLIDLGMSQLTETYYEWKEQDGDKS